MADVMMADFVCLVDYKPTSPLMSPQPNHQSLRIAHWRKYAAWAFA
jgi:hypothetical protein